MIRSRTAIIALLTGLNFVNYLDRFIVAAVLPSIQRDLHLSGFEAGLLATVFLIGYFVTSPSFGSLGDRIPRKYLITIGVVVWSIATIGSGLAGGFVTMILARAAVGVGEASYATLAPTIIDDVTPAHRKGSALATFFLAMPLGSACGYLLGGYVEKRWGWSAAFYVAGGPGLVLALSCLAIVEPARKLAEAKPRFSETISKLLAIPLYRRAVLGYCAHTAAIGAFAYWAPKFLKERYELPLHDADFRFGTITVVAGVIGTYLGGKWADRVTANLPEVPAGSSHLHPTNRLGANAQLRICALGVALSFPLAVAAFVMPSSTLFFVLGGICELGLFLSAAPINAILLRTAPVYLRASAMAAAIFLIHMLGDLWSPPLVGLLSDHLPVTIAMMALPLGFLIAAITWWPRAHEAVATFEDNIVPAEPSSVPLPPARIHLEG